MSDIRSLIRQILLEELESYVDTSGHGNHIESVSIRSNGDLNAFALRVLEIAQTRELKTDLRSGKIKFTLDGNKGDNNQPARPQQSTVSNTILFQKGLVTEKDISRLAGDTTSLNVGKNIFFTPLANDEIRRRGLKIERNSQ